MTHLRVGARGSDLSLAQTRLVLDQLTRASPGGALTTEIVIIQTHGDRDQSTPLESLGAPGGFVKEIERALLEKEIDLAIHSLKDVPTQDTPGLVIAAIPLRAPAQDVLLTRAPVDLCKLPQGFLVGTSSPRRSHQILKFAPQVKTTPIRGNVPTRIRHLQEGKYDAIVLAAAGLERLSISHAHRITLPAEDFLPAPGQGALALQTRADTPHMAIIRRIDDANTRAAVTAEREFLQATGGGCHAALGALATINGNTLTLRGELFAGNQCLRDKVSGRVADAASLGRSLATKVMASLPK
jgi:hydroxymethylbilane synthase